MKADERFLKQPKAFWAYVRAISQQVGYTERGTHRIKVPTLADMTKALQSSGLYQVGIVDERGEATALGQLLSSYFVHRADALNDYAQSRLMTAEQAKAMFKELRDRLSPKCPLPMNKQKGAKRAPAYFTGIINMLIEANAEGLPCAYAPRALITITRDNLPLRTLARWVDGAFPSTKNPVAAWEIKEYYYTTTFGSRVADGIYETLLDGMELEELREHENIDVKHYLMVDDHNTWWNDGRSYLCRIVDILHMRYVDEVLFGREVLERLPALVKEWATLVQGPST